MLQTSKLVRRYLWLSLALMPMTLPMGEAEGEIPLRFVRSVSDYFFL